MGGSSSRHRPHGGQDQPQQPIHPPHVIQHPQGPPQPQQHAYVPSPMQQGPQQVTQYLAQGYVGVGGVYTTAGSSGYTPPLYGQHAYYPGPHLPPHPVAPLGTFARPPMFGGMPPYHPQGPMPQPWGAPHGPQHPPARIPQTHEYQSTDKVKNQANLNKKSIKLVPIEGRPQQYQLHFTFDASAPCRVTTFIQGVEDARQGCAIRATSGRERPPVPYQPGMGLVFPSSPHVAEQHSVCTATYSLELLSQHRGETFPLIIRLESLTEAGVRAGHSLQEVPVGGSLPLWVQAQTTYAHIKQEGSSSSAPSTPKLVIEVVKQKIWVNGMAYEMQDIYGMKESRVSTTPVQGSSDNNADEDVDGRDCVICLTNERDTMVLPCRHLCMCADCASALKTQFIKCPVCRVEIESLMHFKRYDGGPANGAAAAAGAHGAVPAR